MKGSDLPDTVKIDDLDRDIISIFNKDGRISYRKIAKKLDISIGTVHNRMEKLIRNGVIKKFAPVIDHQKLVTTLPQSSELG